MRLFLLHIQSLPLGVLPVGETSRSDSGGAVSGEEKVLNEVKRMRGLRFLCMPNSEEAKRHLFAFWGLSHTEFLI